MVWQGKTSEAHEFEHFIHCKISSLIDPKIHFFSYFYSFQVKICFIFNTILESTLPGNGDDVAAILHGWTFQETA